MYKDMEKANITFTALQAKIKGHKNDKSDLSDPNKQSQADPFFLLKDNYQGLEPNDNTIEQTLLHNNKKNIHTQEVIPEDSDPP